MVTLQYGDATGRVFVTVRVGPFPKRKANLPCCAAVPRLRLTPRWQSSHPDRNANTPSLGSCLPSREGATSSRDDGGRPRERDADQEIPGLHVRRDGILPRKNNPRWCLWYALFLTFAPRLPFFLNFHQVSLPVDSFR